MTADDGPRNQRGGFPVRLGDVLPTALERIGPRTLWVEAKLRQAWAEAVGLEVAAHASVVRLRGSTLEVAASNDAWATQIRYLGSVIADRLNSALGSGVVKDVAVRRKRER